MMGTIAETLQRASDLLDTDTARLDAELLLCHVLDCQRTYLRMWPEKALTTKQQADFEALLTKRVSGHPVSYLIGTQAFWTLDLLVSPATLIPRADTELLVETALRLDLPHDAAVLDLGTGTGAIGLALASERQNWQVLGTDCALDVVELAQQNAIRNRLERVNFKVSDWFSAIEGQQFDLIVSNPPYIDKDDVHLSKGDVRFEPRRALVAENEGLADIVCISEQSLSHLNSGGWLMIEHGFDQGQSVRELLETLGYEAIQTHQDLGQNDRITMGYKP